ncbi:MAG TPA: RDD family protein [Steroidobacteraceae bacterium]|nr:RDD family protein [Steroidobacteraceae bacterium]
MNIRSRNLGALLISLLLWLPLLAHSPPALADDARVSIGHDTSLPADEEADAVVSVFGSSTTAGTVHDSVVSVLGDTRVTGPVGDSAVAVLGSTYVNSPVKGAVVAVLGDIELGPQADVGGDLVAVGGTVKRDPAAITHGQVQNVTIGHMDFKWMRAWVTHCLVLGRPLALSPDLGWAWSIAFVFLALYLLMALLFPKATDRCVQTMETYPGRSALTALLMILLVPIVTALLFVTVVGIIAVPFVGIGLLLANLFGKAVMLAWIGRRIVRPAATPAGHPVLAVLIGGLIVMALYLIPFLGFLIYKLLGFMGFGVVFYTLILERRAARAARPKPPKGGATPASPGPVVSADATADAAANSAHAAGAGDTAAGPEAAAAEPVAPASAVADATPRAGFWIRMAALGIDVLLVALVLALIGHGGPFHDDHRTFLLVLAVYGAVMWKLRGTTVGGIVCKLQVRRLDARPLDWGTVVVRALGSFLSLAVAFLGFIWIAFDSERQSWHDKLAGTVVVQLPQQQSLL